MDRVSGPFNPLEMVRALNRNGVRYVVIGGVAAVLRGSPRITQDLDICYARDDENLHRMASALRSLGAKLRGPGVPDDLPFQLDAETLREGDHFTFRTTAGDFDVMATPSGARGFDDLIATASKATIDGEAILIASIDDLIRMKRAAGRLKDLADIEILQSIREELGNTEA